MAHIECTGEVRSGYTFLIRIPEWKRSVEKSGHNKENYNIQLNFKEMEWEDID